MVHSWIFCPIYGIKNLSARKILLKIGNGHGTSINSVNTNKNKKPFIAVKIDPPPILYTRTLSLGSQLSFHVFFEFPSLVFSCSLRSCTFCRWVTRSSTHKGSMLIKIKCCFFVVNEKYTKTRSFIYYVNKVFPKN